MLPAGRWSATSWVHYTINCNTQSSAPEDGYNNFPKHVELTGIINKPLLLLLVGCLYYLYQWCTIKKISDNEISLLIKYIKSVLWRVVKHLSYIEGARCLKVNILLTTDNILCCLLPVSLAICVLPQIIQKWDNSYHVVGVTGSLQRVVFIFEWNCVLKIVRTYKKNDLNIRCRSQ